MRRRRQGHEPLIGRSCVCLLVTALLGGCGAALSDLVRRYRDMVAFVGIAGQDAPRALARFIDEHGASYPVGLDGSLEIWRRYAVREPPATVLISRGGRLLRGWPGIVETRPLEEALDRLVVRR